MATVGYIRVSTDKQNTDGQKLSILNYVNDHLKGGVDDWIEVKASTRKSAEKRKLDELKEILRRGDTLVVAELSRLARSVGQIAILVDGLVNDGIRVITIKEGMELNGKRDMKTKVMLTMFSLFAEIERDLVSERTKEGLKRARAEGKLLGRPKGTTSSKLDGREGEIKGYLAKGVNLANVARIFDVSWSTMKHFVTSRRLAG
ncbi:MAG: recombinase family protein [Desulfobacteraceae bacterium]|nr:recombinase family protein [Desulfobacteraceae bacterium]MBC2750179.1 recombinase family protein [Desulfobacteraceae bacterium]